MAQSTTVDAGESARRYAVELERRRRSQVIGLVIVVIAALLALAARFAGGELFGQPFVFWGTLAAVVLVMKVLFLFANWRCPHCGAMLGSSYHPRFCSGCGFRFTDDGRSA